MSDTVPYQPHSETSRAAAESIIADGTKERSFVKVYAAILLHGPITDEEIGDLLRMNMNTVRPRRVELSQAGFIRPTAMHKTRSDRDAFAYTAVAPLSSVQAHERPQRKKDGITITLTIGEIRALIAGLEGNEIEPGVRQALHETFTTALALKERAK